MLTLDLSDLNVPLKIIHPSFSSTKQNGRLCVCCCCGAGSPGPGGEQGAPGEAAEPAEVERILWAAAAAAEGLHVAGHLRPDAAALLPAHARVPRARGGHLSGHW